MPEISDFPYNYRISILEVGSIAGDEDILARETYSCSLKCYSQAASVYRIPKEHFLELKKTNSAWLEVVSKIAWKAYRAEAFDIKKTKKA